MRTKKLCMALVAMAVFVGLGSRKAQASSGPSVDATITVTPSATANLSLGVTTYAFGQIPLSSAAVSVSSLSIINIGQTYVTVDSKIQTEANNWVSATSTGVVNEYVLWVATSTVQPLFSQFTAGHQFNTVGSGATPKALKGIGGGSPILTMTNGSNEVDMWFRLDTPSSVNTMTGQTITVRFTGTPN